MRIIAGKYKRTPLKTLEGEEITRPTRDMVKEALFSSIDIYSDTKVLDLFSGSGAIGLEALSRGAEDAVFNDINRDAVRIIKENLKKLNENRTVYNMDYAGCLNTLKGRQFDYIYCDPPYAFDRYDDIFEKVSENDVLSHDGIMIMEVRKDTDLKDRYQDLSKYKEKRYGISKLLYYRKETNNDQSDLSGNL